MNHQVNQARRAEDRQVFGQASGLAAVLATLATLAILAAAGPARAQDTQTFTVPLSRPGQPAHLEVDLINGRIIVIGEDREDMEVSVNASGSKRRIVTPSGSKPIPVTSYALEIDESNNYVEIDSDYRSGPMTVTVRVPTRTDLELDTVHDAGIDVSDVTGDLELSAVHGPVSATNVRGHVIAETVHGELNVEIAEVSNGRPMAFSTVHGDLTVAFPDDFGADISIQSRNDEIYSDFEDVEVMATKPKIERNGGIILEQALNLRINGGGTPVRMETLHGQVSIKRSGG